MPNLFKSKLDKYKELYNDYFEETGKYVYGSCDNWIVVFEKLNDTVTNESRENVLDTNFAEYCALKLNVVLIVSKFFPDEVINKTMHVEFCQIVNYELNEITYQKVGYRLHYFKTVEPAYYEDMVCSDYTGYYSSWHDNGLLSEKGEYVKGEKHGIWTYGETNKTNGDQVLRTQEYDNGVVKTPENKYKLILWTPLSPISLLSQNSTLVGNVVWAVGSVIGYVDQYVPRYLKLNYWLNKHVVLVASE